jgi:phosphate-selective porin OprO/OprP
MKRIVLIVSLVAFGLTFSTDLKAQGCATPTDGEGVQIFGYIQPELRTFFEGTKADPEVNSYFAFRRARVGVMGTIPYDFSYYVLLETSQFMNPGDRTGAFLLDAFISYTRFEYFKISLGSFKYRFGNELSQPCNGLYTINRSLAIDVMTGGIGGGNRDLGVMFLGGDKTKLIQYYASLTNGYGVFETANNNLSNSLAATGRVVIKPIDGLYLGGSYRYMHLPNEDPAVTKKDTRTRWGVDAEFSFRDFKIFGEYIDGEDNGSIMTGGGCGGDAPALVPGSQKSDGFYGMALYRWRNFEPVYKFEMYERQQLENEVAVGEPDSDIWQTFGLNFYPNDWTRLQLNYIYKTEDPLEKRNDCLLLQVQVNF